MRKFFVLLCVAIAMFLAGGISFAALEEKPVLDGINNNIAVLRYLHTQVAQAQGNLMLVRAARDLTQRQLDAQRRLHETAVSEGKEEYAKFYESRLHQLEDQMGRLGEVDFEQLYAQQIDSAQTQIKEFTSDLEARMVEYEVLFGERPKIELNFEDIYKRYAQVRPGAAYFLDLN